MNRRLTRACLASAAMVRGWPALMVASSAARTRRVLAAESRRRSSVSLRVRSAVGSSAMAAAGGGPAFDGGEERRWLRAGQAAQFGGEGDVQGGSLGADRGDGLVDGGAVVVVGGEDFVVGAEQSADRVDFFVGGGGVGAGPVGQGRDRGGQAFPVGQ